MRWFETTLTLRIKVNLVSMFEAFHDRTVAIYFGKVQLPNVKKNQSIGVGIGVSAYT